MITFTSCIILEGTKAQSNDQPPILLLKRQFIIVSKGKSGKSIYSKITQIYTSWHWLHLQVASFQKVPKPKAIINLLSCILLLIWQLMIIVSNVCNVIWQRFVCFFIGCNISWCIRPYSLLTYHCPSWINSPELTREGRQQYRPIYWLYGKLNTNNYHFSLIHKHSLKVIISWSIHTIYLVYLFIYKQSKGQLFFVSEETDRVRSNSI